MAFFEKPAKILFVAAAKSLIMQVECDYVRINSR
jgi:hypothetical protein